MTIVGVLIMVVLLAALVLSGIALHRFVVVPSRRTTRYAMAKAFEPGEVIRHQPFSSCLGLQSSGIEGQQSLGTLVLTAKRLWFHKPGVDGALEIPLVDVDGVELVRRHLGTETGRPLLMVRFTGEHGPDSVAFHLPYPEEWQLAIDNVRG